MTQVTKIVIPEIENIWSPLSKMPKDSLEENLNYRL